MRCRRQNHLREADESEEVFVYGFTVLGAMRAHSHHAARQMDPRPRTAQRRLCVNDAKSTERQRGREPSEIVMCRDYAAATRAKKNHLLVSTTRDLVPCGIYSVYMFPGL